MHTSPEVLALVALGERTAATPQDLDHIAHCEVCGREVSELGHLTEVGRTISDHFTLETPSPQVWNRIRAQLGLRDDFTSDLVPPPAEDQGLPAGQDLSGATGLSDPAPLNPAPLNPALLNPALLGSADSDTRTGRPRRRRVLALTLAVVLAVLAGIGGTLAWLQLRPLTDTPIASTVLEALPDWTGATGEARLEQTASGQQVLVVSMITPRPVDGMQAVWLIDREASSMTQLGFLTAPIERFPLPASFDIKRFPVVDISVEQPDGNLAHSGNSIVRGVLNL